MIFVGIVGSMLQIVIENLGLLLIVAQGFFDFFLQNPFLDPFANVVIYKILF